VIRNYNLIRLSNQILIWLKFCFIGRGIGQAIPSMGAFAKAKVAAAKIFRIIDHKPAIDRNSESGLELESVTGLVALKNIDFAYPSRPDARILNNFSLNVPAGKTIALVGSSGSGKSTVVSLIERFYDPNSGKLCHSFILSKQNKSGQQLVKNVNVLIGRIDV